MRKRDMNWRNMEIENIKDKLEKAIVAVATINPNNRPHAIAIMYAKVKEGKIIITNNYMKSTIQNLKINPYVSLVFWEGKRGWEINGKVDYFDYGEWLDFVKNLPENKNEPVNGALVVSVENIKELG
ncbi:MAG: pyridoxamine 5'-phosphate oxidase family protein [archaeon]